MPVINAETLQGIRESFSTIVHEAMANMAAKSQWPLIATQVPSTGADNKYPYLNKIPGMKKWEGDRQIESLTAGKYTVENVKFEDSIGIDRVDIINDQLGMYRPAIQNLGAAAIRHRDQVVFALLKNAWTELCHDGQPFINDSHPVGDDFISNDLGGASYPWFLCDLSWPLKPLILQIREEPVFEAQDGPNSDTVFMRDEYRYGIRDYKNAGFGLWQTIVGSKDTLDEDAYASARGMLQSFADANGDPLGITPTHLFYHPALEADALLILKGSLSGLANSAWFGSAVPILCPWLV